MRVDEIAPGLWRWTGLHPEWTPASGGPDGWEQEVSCVYAETPDAVVLIDPLVPPEDSERFWTALDRDVERAGRPVALLLTTESHARSAEEIAERYGAAIGSAPAGVEVVDTGWYGEVLYWLPGHAAVAAGDVLLGDGRGGARLADSWLGDDREAVRAALQPLLELPVERVLLAHGQPVVERARESLARALA